MHGNKAPDKLSAMNKTLRFTNPLTSPKNKDSVNMESPLTLAEMYLKATITTLQPQFITILEDLCKNFIAKMKKLNDMKFQISKMDDDKFIPRSAQIIFELMVSTKTAESNEFKTLKTETNELVKTFCDNLKKKVKKATELERDTICMDLIKFYT